MRGGSGNDTITDCEGALAPEALADEVDLDEAVVHPISDGENH